MIWASACSIKGLLLSVVVHVRNNKTTFRISFACVRNDLALHSLSVRIIIDMSMPAVVCGESARTWSLNQ